jgi:hypothetical protein
MSSLSSSYSRRATLGAARQRWSPVATPAVKGSNRRRAQRSGPHVQASGGRKSSLGRRRETPDLGFGAAAVAGFRENNSGGRWAPAKSEMGIWLCRAEAWPWRTRASRTGSGCSSRNTRTPPMGCLWSAISRWCEAYVAAYYPSDEAVQADYELQSWYAEAVQSRHADKRDAPWWSRLSMPGARRGRPGVRAPRRRPAPLLPLGAAQPDADHDDMTVIDTLSTHSAAPPPDSPSTAAPPSLPSAACWCSPAVQTTAPPSCLRHNSHRERNLATPADDADVAAHGQSRWRQPHRGSPPDAGGGVIYGGGAPPAAPAAATLPAARPLRHSILFQACTGGRE